MKTIIVTGIREIDRKLRTLEPRIQKKVVRKSMRDGMKVIASEARTQVPVDSGLTQSAIKTRAVKKRKRGSIEIEVIVDGKVPGLIKQSGKEKVFYPAVVEYGYEGHPGNPFMRRTYESKGDDARDITLHELLRGTLEEVKK